jgi:hypothetical protein
MPIFHSGHFRVFWDVLLDAADRYDVAPAEDKRITLISPWISDVTTSRSGWSDASIASAFNIDTGNIESLSDILGKLVDRGYEVRVLTLSTVGKWLPKARNKNLDSERHFMEKIKSKGVTCLLRNNVHMKYVKTPFAIFAGSINISFNGLSGRNQESAALYYSDTNEQDFRQAKNAIENTLVGSKDYFSPRIPITNWTPPVFESANLGDSNSIYSGGAVDITYYPDVGDEYPDMVPADYLPVGKISASANPETKSLSFKGIFGNLVSRIGMRTIQLLMDETIAGFSEKEILNIIFDGELPDNEDPEAPERLPEIPSMRNLLLSDDNAWAGYINMRLGLVGNQSVAAKWRQNVSEIFDGMMIIQNKLSNPSHEIVQEDIDLLNSLVSRFERGDI